MSRIGYKEIDLPEGVEVSQQGNVVTVKLMVTRRL